MGNKQVIFYLILLKIIFIKSESPTETCIIPETGQEGNCVPLSQCQHMQEEFKKDRKLIPVICDRRLRTICCPPQSVTTRGSFESGLPETTETFTANNQQYAPLNQACSKYRDQMVKNLTVAPFVIGEPAGYQTINYCNINRKDIGVAVEKEFSHVAYIHGRKSLKDRNGKVKIPKQQVVETKCSGSLITENFVLTTALCVSDTRHSSAIVHFGVLNLTSEFEYYAKVEVSWYEIETSGEITLLKLPRKISVNEMMTPTCLSSELSNSNFILTGWTGYRYECNPLLKKWYIDETAIENCNGGNLCISSSKIVNYYEMLLLGSSLQIYHPENECQYIIKGLFKRIFQENYEFIPIETYLPWIQNRIY